MRCFYLASGLKINLLKSCFYGIGLSPSQTEISTGILKCKSGHLPITYLGLVVGTNMNRISNWNPVIQTFENRLSNWKAATLLIGGRITLIRSELDCLPTYYFSLYNAPVSVLSKLEKIRKNFFWGGSASSKKVSWVSWDVVTAPKESGGLGLGSLYSKNLSLLCKWWWRLRMEPNSLWGRTITSIHFSHRNCSPLPYKSGLVGAWLNIAKLCSHLVSFNVSLHNLFTCIVGNGASIRFWIDGWHGNEPFYITFPDLFKLEKKKGCLVRDRCTGNGFFSHWEWSWSKPPSTSVELYQLRELLSRIQNTTLTNANDSWTWAYKPSEPFSVKSMKECLYRSQYGPKPWPFPLHDVLIPFMS